MGTAFTVVKKCLPMFYDSAQNRGQKMDNSYEGLRDDGCDASWLCRTDSFVENTNSRLEEEDKTN